MFDGLGDFSIAEVWAWFVSIPGLGIPLLLALGLGCVALVMGFFAVLADAKRHS